MPELRWRLHLASSPESVSELLGTSDDVDLRNHDPERTWRQGYCDS